MYNQTEDNPFIFYFNISMNFFYVIFGNIGNLFKIAFFLQKPLRSLPCTVYIVASTLSDFITLNNLPVLQLLSYLYPNYHWIRVTVDWSYHRNETTLLSDSTSTYDIIICKIRSYLHLLSTDLSFQMVLFASINRFCSSYRRKKRQHLFPSLIKHFCKNPHVYKLCLISCLISAFVSLQHIFNFTIHSSSEGCIPCNYILWTIWVSSTHCFLLPILMIILGSLTLKTIRCTPTLCGHMNCLHRRGRRRKHQFIEMCTHCSRCVNSIQSQTERQLTSMILSEVFVTVLTSLPYGTYALYDLFHRIQGRAIYPSNRARWIVLFVRITMYFEPSCGFYIYLFTLRSLRNRFSRIIIRKITRISFCFWNK